MGSERAGRDFLNTPSQRRRRLSNITNLSLSANWSSIGREDSLLKSCSKTTDFQLQKENMALKKLLADKEEALEEQAKRFEELQRDHRKLSQVNLDIINYNTRLSKDSAQFREENRLLNHEFKQLTYAYRTQMSELQLKLAETQEKLNKLLEERGCKDPVHLRKTRSQMYRRHSTSGRILLETDCHNSTKVMPQSPAAEENVSRPDVRRRSGRVVLTKETAAEVTQPLPGSIMHINRRSDLIGLEPMVEIPDEECSPRNSSNAAMTSTSLRGECSSKSGLTSEPKGRRRDEASSSACSLSDKSTDLVGPAARGGLNPLRTNKGDLVPPESRKLATSSSAPHFSRRVQTLPVSSSGRPVRKAVVCVSTYREPPLNTKMRRAI
ncbi:hypothetical protein R1flu_015598 [Riccia fluitans]|uniref:Shugoshin C-terminal domain-containing protein n=1 Tax=Riccia fluitans TaxID=41844 RepID=A0ABD1YMH9_9MARC